MAGQCIVVTSGKGGVGKTTITANVGYALASLGKKVLLIDGDIGLKNLDSVLGLERRVVYDLFDVITNRIELEDALVKDKRLPDNLFLLAASQSHFKEDVLRRSLVKWWRRQKRCSNTYLWTALLALSTVFELVVVLLTEQ